MAQADTLVELLKTASSGDQQSFRKTAEKLIQEERDKGHRILAERLHKSLQQGTNAGARNGSYKQTVSAGSARELFYELTPERSLDSLMLSEKVKPLINELVDEQKRAELLHAYNLSPRNRILLAGPPGNGKTTLVEAIAFELMCPLIVIRYESLIGSYLGETSTRLKNLLEYVKGQRCVLFFDEFETLGKERGDTHETGEIKRVVSSLLLQLDELPDYVVLAAASNHPELLDRAVWRRFQLRVELPKPSRMQLSNFIQSISERCRTNFGFANETLAKHLLGSNFAEAEEFCLSVVRRAVLDRKTDDAKSITKLKLEQWRNRLIPSGSRKAEEIEPKG